MFDVLAHATATRHTATRLLGQSRLIETLEQYGKPHLTGSYALDLMFGPDIDITMVTDRPRETSRAVLNSVLDQDYFQRYEYGDFVRFPVPQRPRGYILVLALTIAGVYWETEIWFLAEPSPQETSLMTFVQEQLTPSTRTTILDLKYQRQVRGLDKHRVSSAAIYLGVLRGGARTLEEIERQQPTAT
jgi:hypothetical protein